MTRLTFLVNGEPDTQIDLPDGFQGSIDVQRQQPGDRQRRAAPYRRRSLLIAVFCFVGTLLWSFQFHLQHSTDDVFTKDVRSAPSIDDRHSLIVAPPAVVLGDADQGTQQQQQQQNNDAFIPNVDLVGVIVELVDHARRFLLVRQLTNGRHLAEQVTGPVFGQGYSPQRLLTANHTGDLLSWVFKTTEGVCKTIGLFAALHPVHAQASSFAPLYASIGKACRLDDDNDDEKASDWAFSSHLRSWVSTTGLRDQGLATLANIIASLGDFEETLAFLAQGDYAVSAREELQHERKDQHHDSRRIPWWRSSFSFSNPLARLDSSSPAAWPFDLDSLTTVVLTYLRGSDLFPHAKSWNLDATTPPFTQNIRDALAVEQQELDRIITALADRLLPRFQAWVEDLTSQTEEEEDRAGVDVDHHHHHGNSHDRFAFGRDKTRDIRAVSEGIDQLVFLLGFLRRYNAALPGLVPRLDRWDATVEHLAEELDLVLGTGRSLIRRGRRGRRGEAVVQRWRIRSGPYQELYQTRLGLLTLMDRLLAVQNETESFNPEDAWVNAWFARQLASWNRDKLAERAEWVADLDAKRGQEGRELGAWAMTAWDNVWPAWL